MERNSNSAPKLAALSAELAGLAEAAASQVVWLDTRGGYPTSGTLWEGGYVVTADHALRHDAGIHVTLKDGRELEATIAGRDAATDLALLAVEGVEGGFPRELEAGALRPGSLAIALGRNSEKSLNASLAVINAIGGEWATRFGGKLENYLRLDVPIYPGFSGGPLVDPAGALIGINSSRLSRRSAVAIPAASVRRLVEGLKERGYIRHGYLGIASLPIQVNEGVRRELALAQAGGLMLLESEPGSGAQKAGLLQGDILIDLDGTPVQDPEELQSLLGPESVGRRMKARLVRAGRLAEVEVEIGERPPRRGGGEGWTEAHRQRSGGGR